MEVFAGGANVRYELFHQPQKLDRHRTGKRSASECGSMHAGMQRGGHVIGGENCSQRQSRGQRLRNRHNIGRDPIVLIGEITAGAAETALDFIKKQKCSTAFGQLAREFQKLGTDGTNSSLTLNGFQADGAYAGVKLPLQIVAVVEFNEADSGQERREGIAIFGLAGCSQRPEGPSVKRIVECENAPLRLVDLHVLQPPVRASEL